MYACYFTYGVSTVMVLVEMSKSPRRVLRTMAERFTHSIHGWNKRFPLLLVVLLIVVDCFMSRFSACNVFLKT
jgi:hypothetical protein